MRSRFLLFFRAHQSTETALLSLLSEIYFAVYWSEITLLTLYDVSAAFDMFDHGILLNALRPPMG